jgi:hypothetical protein
MINPLKAATAGYLKRGTKAVLIIAVAGYLNYGGSPEPPNPPSGGGGGGSSSGRYNYRDADKELREKILREDSEIIAIVELTLKTVII